jgi:hypothetical protein
VAATLHTPLPAVLAMDWAECLRWWSEADRIHGETFGLLAGIAPRNPGEYR